MLEKRARQIPRTTSMSHLGPRFPSVGDSPLQPRNSNSVAGGQKISRALDGMQDQSNSPQIVEPVEDELGMEMNLDQISGHCDGLLLAEDSLTSGQIEECHTSLDRSTEKSSYISGQASSWSNHMVPVPVQAKYQDATSIRPAEFLKMCFFCSRRLGHGQDIYIYRGDVAFCSEECRNHQILKDERKDKCSVSASKKGSAPPPVKIESGGKAVSSGTAVGA